jgi:hypothetical protein
MASPFPVLVRSPEALRTARQALNLSADGLAQMLRIEDGRTVRRWESGESSIPGPAIVVLETAMSYLNERAMIARQLEMMRSGKMRTGVNNVDDTAESIDRLVAADSEYEGALLILKSVDTGLETLTRQPPLHGVGSQVHWYSLYRQTPRFDPPQANEWSMPNEVSPEAALLYFEKHESFTGGLELCGEPDDLSAEFILEEREVHRILRGRGMSLQPGRTVRQFAVRRRKE